MQVVAHRDLCIGAESCVADFSAGFALDDEGRVRLLPGLDDLSDDDLQEAVDGCPSGALALVEDDA